MGYICTHPNFLSFFISLPWYVSGATFRLPSSAHKTNNTTKTEAWHCTPQVEWRLSENLPCKEMQEQSTRNARPSKPACLAILWKFPTFPFADRGITLRDFFCEIRCKVTTIILIGKIYFSGYQKKLIKFQIFTNQPFTKNCYILFPPPYHSQTKKLVFL